MEVRLLIVTFESQITAGLHMAHTCQLWDGTELGPPPPARALARSHWGGEVGGSPTERRSIARDA